MSNLKNVGLAFRIFATDNEDRFPQALAAAKKGSKEFVDDPLSVWRHFLAVSNELNTPKFVICPSDRKRTEATVFSPAADRKAPLFKSNKNLSYFVGVDAAEDRPQGLLAGDRHITNLHPVRFTFGTARVGPLGTNHSAETGAGWTDGVLHGTQGNIALGDGSVQQSTTHRLRDFLRRNGNSLDRIAVPD